MSAPEFVTKIKDACGNLLQACKKLVNGVEQRSPEEEFVLTARSCAAGALDIHKLLTAHVSSIPESKQEQTNLSQTFILESSSKLRETVVLLVKYARNLQNNPVDFLSKQSLGNTLKDVVIHTKSVFEAAAISEPQQDLEFAAAVVTQKPTTAQPRSFVSHAPASLRLPYTSFTATSALHEAENGEEDAAKGASSGDSKAAAATAAEITKDLNIGQELADQSGIVLNALQSLSDSIAEQNADAFNAATKEAVVALQGLTTALQKAVKTENALKTLLEANLQVITAAKVFFKKPTNEQLASKFQDARNDVVNAMRQLLFEVSKSNARLSRTLSRGISQKQIGGVLRQGLRREGSSGISSPKINIDKAKSDDSTPAKLDSPKPESPKPAGDSAAPSSVSGVNRLALPSDHSPPGLKRNPLADSGSIDKDLDSPGREDGVGGIRRRKASTNLAGGVSPREPPKADESESLKKEADAATTASGSPIVSRSPGPDKPRLKRIESSELRRVIDDRESKKPEEEDKDKKGKDKKKDKEKRLSRSNSSRPKDGSPSRTRKDSLSQSIDDSMEDSTEDTLSNSAETSSSSTPPKASLLTSSPSSSPLQTAGPTVLSRSAPSTAKLTSRQSSGSLGPLDKTAIAHRILDVIKLKFPGFATEWESADNGVKLGVEAKIVAELALYHIAVLQEVPGARPGAATAPAPAAAKAPHPAAQAIAAANLTFGSSEDTKKARPSTSAKAGKERTEKSKTALPSFMKLFSRDKDNDDSSSSKRKGSAAPPVEEVDDKEKAQMQELERIMEMKDASELSGMTVRLKGAFGGKTRLKTQTSKTSVRPEKDDSSSSKDVDTKAKIVPLVSDKTPELAQQFAVAVQFLTMKIKDSMNRKKEWDQNQIYSMSRKTQQILRSVMGFVKEMAQDQISSEAVSGVLAKTDDDLEVERSGKIQEVDSSLTTQGRFTRLVRKQLQQSLGRWCASLHFTASQVNTDLFELTRIRSSHAEIDVSVESTMLHVCALISTFLTTLEQVLNDLETLHYFADDAMESSDDSSSSNEDIDTAPKSTGLWDTFNEVSIEPKELFRPASLNTVVTRCLNAPDDTSYQLIVMETYNSFTSSHDLLSKLIEAFYVPKGKMDDARTSKHHKRVMDFLSSWVRYARRFDFDSRFLKRLRRFLDEALKAAPEEAESIKAVIEEVKKGEQEGEETDVVEELPKEIVAFEADVNPFSFLLCFDSMLIAKQLTRIEYEMYRRIDPIELKGQAWNKPKRQCVSRNILSLIQRANRLSFWIATSILLQPKLKDRGRVVVKIINIAQQLKEMNNFNTLMGFVAGLNMSCVSRLKHTFNQVSKRSLEQYKALQELLDPKSSFKSLRDAIKNGGTTILPYIGTTLSDLTFMEDGNPDFADEAETLINMEKRRLVANAIGQIKQYQNSGFNKLTVRDPPYSFLVELPSLSEQTLYALSLEREPRESATRSK